MKKINKTIKLLFFNIITLSLILGIGINTAAAEKNAFEHRYNTAFSNASDTDNKSIEVASRFWELIFGKRDKNEKNNGIYLCPGGDAFGIKISGSGVTVSKIINESFSAPLHADDKIVSIDGKKISTIQEVKDILNSSGGRVLDFEVLRGGKKINLNVTPHPAGSEYHLGVILSDGASGIGTITYYNPNTLEFGGLGHGICAKDNKDMLKMTRGEVTDVILAGAKRGEPSKPGELRGVLTDKTLGSIKSNTECGVFGTLTAEAVKNDTPPIQVGYKDSVKEGEATIISTIKSGNKSEYKIEIYDIDESSTESKSFKIRVTDETLLALTGGIVRGMSGSPIIQDGKLIGAVTHVMVADPTEGYGIFIENMLNACQEARNELPSAA